MRLLALTAAFAVSLAVGVPAAPAAGGPHVVGTFAMSGVVTKAYNVQLKLRDLSSVLADDARQTTSVVP
jgi:hypothetical protein